LHQRWRQAFRVFDAEQQGWVDAEKLRRVFASFGDYELSDEQLETMLPPPPAGCPSNGTGRVAIRLPQVSQNGYLLSRRGRSSPANASGFDTHRDSISSRFDCSLRR
jgi:hypothetical protein